MTRQISRAVSFNPRMRSAAGLPHGASQAHVGVLGGQTGENSMLLVQPSTNRFCWLGESVPSFNSRATKTTEDPQFGAVGILPVGSV